MDAIAIAQRATSCPTCGATGLDDLTAVLTRARWSEIAFAALDEARRLAAPASVLIVDLDRLKVINDSYGHIAGDLVVRAVADLLTDVVGDGGIVGRLSGRADEFVVM